MMAFALVMVPGGSFANSGAGYLALKHADELDGGAGPGFMYTWGFENGVRIDARLSYLHFWDPDVDMVPIELTSAYQFETDSSVSPYLGAGVGYYFLSANRGNLEDDFGIQIYGGLKVELKGNFDFFAELNWLFLEADTDSVAAKDFGNKSKVDLDGVGLNLGLVHRF
jgi:hypothetical protein